MRTMGGKKKREIAMEKSKTSDLVWFPSLRREPGSWSSRILMNGVVKVEVFSGEYLGIFWALFGWPGRLLQLVGP